MIKEFNALLDAAETDPRPAWKRAVAQIVERELGPGTQIPLAVAADIARKLLQELATQLCAALEDGNIAGGRQAIADFERALRKAVAYERTSGRLKPVTAESELKRCSRTLAEHLWNSGAEHDALRKMIKPGEVIQLVGFWKITTNQREIGRGEVRVFLKPLTWTNRAGTWESQYISDNEVREAEEDAARRAKPPRSENFNHDLPSGIRE